VVSRERDDDENARAARGDGGYARARMCSAKSRRSFVRASRDTALKSSRARRIRVIHRHFISCNVGGGVSRAAGVSVFFFTFTALHHEWCG